MHAQYHISPERRELYRKEGFWGDASLADWWRHAVLACPDRRAVRDNHGAAFTYREFDDQASRLAAWLKAKGIGRGDGVAIDLPGWCEFTAAYIACLKLGAVTVPILPSWREAELSWALEKCEIRAVFTPTAFKKVKPVEMMARLAKTLPQLAAVVAVDKLEGLPEGLGGDEKVAVLSEILEKSEPLDEEAKTSGDDLAAVLFTSGTEGLPKGVMLTHNNILASERAYAARLGLSWLDSFLMPAPLGTPRGFFTA